MQKNLLLTYFVSHFQSVFFFQENSVEAYEEENYRPKDILANLTIGWSHNKKNHLINSFDFHHQENIQNWLGQYYADDDDDDYSMAGSLNLN